MDNKKQLRILLPVTVQSVTDITKVKRLEAKRRKKMTATAITLRRNILSNILADDARSARHKPMKRTDIIEAMRNAGYRDYSIMAYHRDKTALNASSTFVQDLCQSNYSAYIEEIYNKLIFLEEQAVDMYSQDWNSDKTILKKIEGISDEPEKIMQEIHKTAPAAAPKLKALELVAKAQEIKAKIITGDTLQLSAAMLGQKYSEMQEEIERLRKLVPKEKQHAIREKK